MLQFGSGNSSQMNSAAAMVECIEKAAGESPADIDVLLIHTTVGHKFKALLAAAAEHCPQARIVGCTGSGVIHSEGVTEAMRAMAVMSIQGPEVAAPILFLAAKHADREDDPDTKQVWLKIFKSYNLDFLNY